MPGEAEGKQRPSGAAGALEQHQKAEGDQNGIGVAGHVYHLGHSRGNGYPGFPPPVPEEVHRQPGGLGGQKEHQEGEAHRRKAAGKGALFQPALPLRIRA